MLKMSAYSTETVDDLPALHLSDAECCPPLTNLSAITRLDTSASQPEYLVVTDDGRSLRASSSMAVMLETMWKGGCLGDIAGQVSLRLDRLVNSQDIEYVIEHFVKPHNLIQSDDTRRLKRKRHRHIWLIKLPLLSPALLQPFTRPTRQLFSRHSLLIGLILIGLVQMWFYVAQVANFNFASLSSQEYLMVWILCLGGIWLHELGHVSACDYHQCPHGPIGIGLYGFFPVFYADVSQVWSLTRGQRAIVDLGGVYFQAILSTVLVVLYAVTRHAFLAGAVILTNAMIVYNLNPLLKFDGYWLLSDLVGIPNLHKRVWAYFKGWLHIGPRAVPDTPRAEKLVFKLYALALLIFVCYFGWALIRYAPGLARSYPRLVGSTLEKTYDALTTGAWSAFAGSFLHFLFLLLFALGLGRMLWVSTLAVGRFFKRQLQVRLCNEL